MANPIPVPDVTPKDWDRFFSKVSKREDGCWEWIGGRFTQGYGVFVLGGKARRAHRVLYVWTHGDPGLGLDHECRNRWCVNPDHLTPKTAKENVLLGVGPTAVNAAKTHCVNGHEFNEQNTYLTREEGWRYCRACSRERMARKRETHRDHINAVKRSWRERRKAAA